METEQLLRTQRTSSVRVAVTNSNMDLKLDDDTRSCFRFVRTVRQTRNRCTETVFFNSSAGLTTTAL